jgi:hypothetical protein
MLPPAKQGTVGQYHPGIECPKFELHIKLLLSSPDPRTLQYVHLQHHDLPDDPQTSYHCSEDWSEIMTVVLLPLSGLAIGIQEYQELYFYHYQGHNRDSRIPEIVLLPLSGLTIGIQE